ncbi:hypothetical protein BPAE_0044g00550 [Botrytis paeoniae]|uniref:Uncharacterized protein n=1 Tax=Botrytis paeoniae TaxID=278948 RepID=A0A4Z1FVI3_9HELO|nr:hypothetical protein BPAE_0044g00550 [Botrytis paeoniae]
MTSHHNVQQKVVSCRSAVGARQSIVGPPPTTPLLGQNPTITDPITSYGNSDIQRQPSDIWQQRVLL